MKKIFLITLLVLLVTGCSMRTGEIKINLSKDKVNEVEQSVESDLNSLSTYKEMTGFTKFPIAISDYNLNLDILVPDSIIEIKNISSHSFMLVNKNGSDIPSIFRINFYSEDFINKLVDCNRDYGPCRSEDLSNRITVDNIKDAIENLDNSLYPTKKYNGRNYVVINHEPAEDIYMTRKYITFINNIRVDILIAMESELQVEEADLLFNQFEITEK